MQEQARQRVASSGEPSKRAISHLLSGEERLRRPCARGGQRRDPGRVPLEIDGAIASIAASYRDACGFRHRHRPPRPCKELLGVSLWVTVLLDKYLYTGRPIGIGELARRSGPVVGL